MSQRFPVYKPLGGSSQKNLSNASFNSERRPSSATLQRPTLRKSNSHNMDDSIAMIRGGGTQSNVPSFHSSTNRPSSAYGRYKDVDNTTNVHNNNNRIGDYNPTTSKRPQSSYSRTTPTFNSNNHNNNYQQRSNSSNEYVPKNYLKKNSRQDMLGSFPTEEDMKKSITGRKNSVKRIQKYQEEYLPPHTCNVFYQQGRHAVKNTQCKRCSMAFRQQQPKKPTPKPKKPQLIERPPSPEGIFMVKENVNNAPMYIDPAQNLSETKQLLKDNIKQLLYHYRDEKDKLYNLSKGVQTGYLDEPYIDYSVSVKPNRVRSQKEFNDYVSRGKRIELFDDDEYLRLMKEYGVDCEPNCFQIEGRQC
ncbi:hypothetical protein NAEGRDRAFT_80083 [Naegleria gruberi]|uniref:Uncharacterized protein n=1 Tax=Naegleria gruberi TaxID=5762 RepID=D2VIG0_NAEGR|nr:uncharacterized protein NAEGRDRAFT_80083 [Naegleria gruberi]EFC43260.1 hypothetical protein NAEGRDRAFT_80083 [Naegleria gruberi]|eukprot:XP_002676004.1 hypothetical protein NAEGRDRAFT_80083 [Naegleria gruberi strain NEG-M]